MDPKGDSNSSISETKYPRRFRKLVIGLRVFALAVTIAGIVVAAIAAQRSPIAIGILGPVSFTAPWSDNSRLSAHRSASFSTALSPSDRWFLLYGLEYINLGGAWKMLL
ncbi:hypothetical protein ACHAPD_006935 [Fusarium lateritium]